MVYERLPITTRHLEIIGFELLDFAPVVRTLPVAILATCRLVNSEAGAILKPKLDYLRSTPPRFVISSGVFPGEGEMAYRTPDLGIDWVSFLLRLRPGQIGDIKTWTANKEKYHAPRSIADSSPSDTRRLTQFVRHAHLVYVEQSVPAEICIHGFEYECDVDVRDVFPEEASDFVELWNWGPNVRLFAVHPDDDLTREVLEESLTKAFEEAEEGNRRDGLKPPACQLGGLVDSQTWWLEWAEGERY